ncbi:hypothetical protein LY78DRAFT_595357, partial [Colletotrichum sublineola]
GHKEVVETLVKEGADVNTYNAYHGDSLQSACFRGHTEIVQMMHQVDGLAALRRPQQLLATPRSDISYTNTVQTTVTWPIAKCIVYFHLQDGGTQI